LRFAVWGVGFTSPRLRVTGKQVGVYVYHYLQNWSWVFEGGVAFFVGFPNDFLSVFLRIQILPFGGFDW